MNVLNQPFALFVLADLRPKTDPEWTQIDQYENFWGYEIEMLNTASHYLNFTYTIQQPFTGIFASLTKEGKWVGMLDEISRNMYHFVIGDMFVTYARSQVSSGSIAYDSDFLTIASAKPGLRPKYLNLIYPFNRNVWIALLVTIVVCTVAFFIVSRIEGYIIKVKFHDWYTLPTSLWYIYGTFVGESITRE